MINQLKPQNSHSINNKLVKQGHYNHTTISDRFWGLTDPQITQEKL